MSLFIEISLTFPSTFLTVKYTFVPFSPLINLTASESLIPKILTASSSSSCLTLRIASPFSSELSLHAGPPEIISVISTLSIFFLNIAPIPA